MLVGSYFESTEGEIEIWVSLRFHFCHKRRDRFVTSLDFVFERIDKAKEVRDWWVPDKSTINLSLLDQVEVFHSMTQLIKQKPHFLSAIYNTHLSCIQLGCRATVPINCKSKILWSWLTDLVPNSLVLVGKSSRCHDLVEVLRTFWNSF